jgi:uncharacterized protein (TIGR02271 family)
MSRTITAYFDSRTDAQAAYDQLLAAGIPATDLNIHDSSTVSASSSSVSSESTTTTGESKGFWASLGDLFMPDEDRYAYEEGLRRGGSVLTVRAENTDFDVVSDILENSGAVDLDTREAQWRSEGWSGYDVSSGRSTAAATDTSFPYAETTTGTSTGYRAGEGVGISGAGSTGTASSSGTYAAGTGVETRGDYIPVAEEQLRVGKREVDHGRVRIRSYVVETPVEESVALRNETVHVERNAVDRAATDADHLFREQVIEAEARSEEAVVSKEARIVEEVRLDKDVQVRDETVRDTVRRTEVEIEDERTGRTLSDTTLTETEIARKRGGSGTNY